MSTLDRYILRALLSGLGVGTLGLLTLVWLINSLKFLDWFVNKGLSLATFLKVTLLLLPGFMTVFLPLALFAVALFTYNKLSGDRELIVMRSAGMGPWRLARPALILCAALTAFGYFLTLGVVPSLESSFDDIKVQVRDDISGLVLRDGQFNQVEKDLVVYVGRRAPDGTLLDLMIHDTSDRAKETTVVAESGALVRTGGDVRLMLLNGNRQEHERGSERITFLYFDSYSIALSDDQATDKFRYRDERQRPLNELWSIQVGDRMDPDYPYIYEHRHVRRLRMELHLRLIRPLAHVGFLLLGLGAVLSGQFSRRGNGFPVGVAVALVVLFQAASLGAASMAKKSYDALFLMDALAVLPLVVGALWIADVPHAVIEAGRRMLARRASPPSPARTPAP
ncbi:LPS export ABC transporter permease LptF [Pararhodospirillum oryzae]|uniref:LPS export ABC transporter permease LptF n=1 Tax=Pararhodospirillum oryzae TaxID=478448 RepID=A0A512HAC5_9PROT|nr:LPS export ABC transporter permease LptF [Pararhodospirillum oryzae]GEO82399.1 LPS export ABC transporter permease LptF [Pararhodospirillum oryzae]